MPQMAPLSWILLFLFFTIMFIIFNMMNYYIYSPKNLDSNLNKLNKFTNNWKW
uniref:ATP synthase complex subunit 8 n=1 Tax=Anachauliodes laboissierei TaxID=1641410 RepID=A0A8K1ZAS8_9NEOP|nr:ATP synthase F0 subunit 8 [Anachauliodes laboissierei]